jgi:WhiB family redox-sensing transcriptional regulator
MGGRGESELLGALSEAAWQDEGDCRRWAGVIDFFPKRGESAREAKGICASCPVREPCLEFALREKITHGVWGGMTELERRQMRRQRRRQLSG